MKKIIAGLSVLALLALPAVGQDKEEDRVKKAGTVIKEIMNIPDDIPAGCDRQGGLCCGFTFGAQACLWNRRQLWPRSDDLPWRQEFPWPLERSHHDGA